jgi:uncharacterized protein YndB with AHSA1/START domain
MPNPHALSVSLPQDDRIEVARSFAAPPVRVFDAMVDPDVLPRWLTGPPGFRMVRTRIEPRAGGSYEHVWSGPQNVELRMHGRLTVFDVPVRIERNEILELAGRLLGEQRSEVALHPEAAGGTRLVTTIELPSKQARNATLAGGFEQTLTAAYARLDALLDPHAPHDAGQAT